MSEHKEKNVTINLELTARYKTSFIVSLMDIYGVKQLGDEENRQTESKKLVSFIFYHSGITL
jgi:hypothetical protein